MNDTPCNILGNNCECRNDYAKHINFKWPVSKLIKSHLFIVMMKVGRDKKGMIRSLIERIINFCFSHFQFR